MEYIKHKRKCFQILLNPLKTDRSSTLRAVHLSAQRQHAKKCEKMLTAWKRDARWRTGRSKKQGICPNHGDVLWRLCSHEYVSLGRVCKKVSLQGIRKNKKMSSDILWKLIDILLACSGSISITTKGTFFYQHSVSRTTGSQIKYQWSL